MHHKPLENTLLTSRLFKTFSQTFLDISWTFLRHFLDISQTFLRHYWTFILALSPLTDSPQEKFIDVLICSHHAKNMRHLKHAMSQIFQGYLEIVTMSWSYSIPKKFACFAKVTLSPRSKLANRVFHVFYKKPKKLCSQIFLFFKKFEKFMVTML